MRARLLLLVLAVLAIAGFAYQNWSEIARPTLLNFGVLQSQAPLGLILLTLLGLALVVFAAGLASVRTRALLESRQHAKALHAQRELADKAEASRFTDLRMLLDQHLRDEKQRESIAASELDKTLSQHQRELRSQIEQMYHLLTSRLTELERRLDGRPQRVAEPAILERRTETVQAQPAEPATVAHPRERV